MSANPIRNLARWLPTLVGITLAVALLFVIGLAHSDWRAWSQFKLRSNPPAAFRPDVLTWKQPIVPVQFEQASCGACHRDDLPQTPRLNHGRELLTRYNCIGCHRLQDIQRPAMLGPDLTDVGAKLSRQWIYKWLKDPRTVLDADGNVLIDGVYTNPRMPKFQLTDLELRALSAFLSQQHPQAMPAYRFSPRVIAIANKGGDAADQGQVRFNQMFCVTCHALSVDRGGETTLIGGNIGPELTKVGSKVNSAWLIAWLRNPQGYLQHTRMPRYQWSDQDLYEVSQYILTRLTDPDLLKDVPTMTAPTQDEIALGKQLFVSKGCVQCHALTGLTPQQKFAPDLSNLGMSAGPQTVFIKMPRDNRKLLHFEQGNVSGVHVTLSQIPRFMIAYIQAKITHPTTVTPAARMPQFHMSQADLDDVTTALLSMSGPPAATPAQRSLIVRQPHPEFQPTGPFAELYHRYQCEQCHAFRGYGGHLAPDLSYEGSRSQRDWIVSFLRNPQTLRPTLTVRMPEFNMPQKDAEVIADYLSSHLTDSQLPQVDPNQFTAEMAQRGQKLYSQTYQCQSCHTIGASGGYVGPSLNNAGNWLTPTWLEAWLRDPDKLIPGTIEPHHAMTNDQIRDLTAYLLTLKQTPGASSTGSAMGGQE